jgi:hypothetical protein
VLLHHGRSDLRHSLEDRLHRCILNSLDFIEVVFGGRDECNSTILIDWAHKCGVDVKKRFVLSAFQKSCKPPDGVHMWCGDARWVWM